MSTYFPTTNIPLDPIPLAVPFPLRAFGLPFIVTLPLTDISPFILGDAFPFILGELTMLFRRLRLPSLPLLPNSWTTTISASVFGFW
jgi:hypothetical protein